MGSRQAPLPDSVACSRLEAKLDKLAQKLDVHLAKAEATTGACPVCLTCCKHAERYQVMGREVQAQAELLDRLEKRTAEILGVLERMVKAEVPDSATIKPITTATPTVSIKVASFESQRDCEVAVIGSTPTGGGASANQPKGKSESDWTRAQLTPANQDKTCTVAVDEVVPFNLPLASKHADSTLPPAKTTDRAGMTLCPKEVEPSKRPIGLEPKNATQVSATPFKITIQPKEPGPRCRPQGKGGPQPAGLGPDSGIQIRVFPAAQDIAGHGSTVQTSAEVCQKVIDDMPPRPALFLHRCVSPSLAPISDEFLIHTWEVLGSGRFGKVYRCKERSSGLMLAAKVINTRNAKEKEMALNEVQVMNQLSHSNVLQLYQAMETRNQVVLILEYVEGGELFDRIVDESTPLTEVDAMVFVKQICEALHYMHQMYVIHLDLKPENILCVDHTSHQVKIIDFGLARRYKPGGKLRVNFGTPEFLAPEVVNFDFVSFPTDMWTLGVVTYMLVSGMSPFLGDEDSQTLSNVLAATWYFDEDAFEHVSAEARDFISNLLIREKGGRMSAAQCLKHPWLNNISEKAKHLNMVLKSQVLLRKYMAKKLWKKNYIAVAAANRLKKIGSSGSLTSLGV
ncbi:unnamed protein product [Lota lota]